MTDRLSIYNGAIVTHLGEEPLDTLSDDVPARYAMDNVWDRDGVKTCLQHGQWNFAGRSARLDYESGITPEFGFRYAFVKPTDYVRLMGLSVDEYFSHPYRNYTDESGYWWSDVEQLFVRYVSDDSQYGFDFSNWPANFTRYVEGWFALQVTNLSTYSDKRSAVKSDVGDLLTEARGTDAQEQPSRQNPRGSWASARSSGDDRDIGSRSRLTG